MSRLVLACAAACALTAALAVVDERVGLALTVALLLAIATGVAARPRNIGADALAAHDGSAGADAPDVHRRGPADAGERDERGKRGKRAGRWALGRSVPLVLAIGLAVQPTLRDAGPVVAVAVPGALLAGAWAVVPATSWAALARIAGAPLRLDAGVLLLGRVCAPAAARLPRSLAGPLARGSALAVVVAGTFAVLLGSADSAFAELAGNALDAQPDLGSLPWRLCLGSVAAAVAGALAFARLRSPATTAEPSPTPRIETTVVLVALVGLFAAFVAVQLRVLFGGPAYVRATTGLGYGEYARSGFVALLVAAALTLVVVAVAARRRDGVTRGLLAALCVLTLVMLTSAHHRLMLVEDAYGLTRVRFGGHAIVLALAVVFLVVLAAGAHRRLAARAPGMVAFVVLVVGLGFCVANPDARIADAAGGRDDLDAAYLSTLSADALPGLDRLPDDDPADAVRARLGRPDGIAGFNLARTTARTR